MASSTEHTYTTGRTELVTESLGYDFALLGLSASEARVETIRRAACETAERIQRTAIEDTRELDSMLSDLASSTYRLLDPRRRAKSLERVRLSVCSEGDWDLQSASRRPLLPPGPPLVAAELVEPAEKEKPTPAPRSSRCGGPEAHCRVGRIAAGLVVSLLVASVSVVTWLLS